MTPDVRQSLRPILAQSPGATDTVSDEEGDLVAAVLRKDRKATALFVDRYADKLYRYVRLRLAPRTELVEDVVQDIFVAALRGLDRFQGQSTVQSWLIGIARHKVEDYYRARLRAPSNLSDLGDAAIATTASSPRIDERIDHERQRDTVKGGAKLDHRGGGKLDH